MSADEPFHNPFAALGGLGQDRSRPEPPASAETPPEPPAAGPGSARAVVRLERSGRRGKEVTVIEHLDLSDAGRSAWLKALKAQLGCGGSVEGDALVVQGDHRKRVASWLTARGVRRVTVA